ncbi:MAG: hypothetical protein A2275_05930 [Bacteroidetes bacterium RIFOXYA12_FULL_35_11]|nr:MAG: hypothetical protein A2X01_20160 [Bacteroidetes bacterium GWF2_35_48]OFY75501.1 MAG: hypothetical protein A2275_05930 [Bacteroidetes bacterium RIFOXYA12_FULL_35_11]
MFLAFIVNAQITITESDVLTIGESNISAVDTLPSRISAISPGSAGANQTWTFTTVVQIYNDTVEAVNPTGIPYASSYPNANIVVNTRFNNFPSHYYLKKDANDLFVYGISADVANTQSLTNVPFTPGFSLIKFPSTYNSTFTDNYKSYLQMPAPPNQLNADSIKRNAHTNRVSLVDTYGSLTTPTGTFPNTIRQKVTEITIDTMWAKIPIVGWYQISTSNDTIVTYSWWAQEIGMPVCEIEHYPHVTPTTNQVKWYIDPASYIAQENLSQSSFVYPNPASDEIIVTMLDSNKEYVISIFDMLGKEIKKKIILNENLVKLNTDNMPNGLYMLNIIENGKPVKAEKILISR